jgi:putative (di)nucleoside polyphosphate hydrolase
MACMHFRANVVAIVTDTNGRVMAFERTDVPGAWQLPQGGVDGGETPEQAAWRELGEETGLGPKQVELVGEFSDWTAYLWPTGPRKNGRMGQVQRWFTFRVLSDDVEPVPDGVEFTSWKWATREWLVEQVVDFRRPSYQRVLLDDGA